MKNEVKLENWSDFGYGAAAVVFVGGAALAAAIVLMVVLNAILF